ncbi:UNVERIFIED_CONTAM: hypothetical protein GTU68_056764 [Idotea baltica]|nr:hypothetical protein [Idotea baltica]
MKTIASNLGLHDDDITPQGRYKAKVNIDALKHLEDKPSGKLILVTAITPTPLGEGKTVTTIGLAQGLAKLGESVSACIRQPSMGPVFGVKGGAAGGGYSQVAPMEELNLHLTGDIHAITAAHNLASAAIDARIYHEQRLGIDPTQVVWKRVMDHNDRALRMVTIGKNEDDKTINGYEREDGFDITAASELMAILALASDLQDLRQRIGRIVVAYNLDGEPVTTEDLQVAGAMTVTMKFAINPTLMQTLEGVPTFVHSGPFANIAHGNSSIIADNIALKLTDYTVTEGGFGSDMGLEKACNIKAAVSKKAPDCAVLVATLRGIKANYQDALNAGLTNLQWHIANCAKYGLPVVVAINRFPEDTQEELDFLRDWVSTLSSHVNVNVAISEAFVKGGEGAIDLAKKVVLACQKTTKFTPLYTSEMSLFDKLNAVAIEGYGAECIELSKKAQRQLEKFEQLGYKNLSVCMAKTPASISTDGNIKGAPSDFVVPIRELKLCAGAGFIYALCGNVMTMPGLPEKPAFMNLDIDNEGNITGLS